mmetsp:Transcript_18718/g.38527  ORF Transcript_18718/g.38527 Transcript_18718/m.38527 type:complete len:89 (-) Transcript_18718:422-688(-)
MLRANQDPCDETSKATATHCDDSPVCCRNSPVKRRQGLFYAGVCDEIGFAVLPVWRQLCSVLQNLLSQTPGWMGIMMGEGPHLQRSLV